MSIELIDRGIMNTRRQAYTLNTNSLAGFKTAVNNGQTRLALEYAEVLIDQLMSRVADLENKDTSIIKQDVVSQEEVVESKNRTPRQKKQTQEETSVQES